MRRSTRGSWCFFFFQAEDGIRDVAVTGVQTCALPIWLDLGLGHEGVPRGGRRGPAGHAHLVARPRGPGRGQARPDRARSGRRQRRGERGDPDRASLRRPRHHHGRRRRQDRVRPIARGRARRELPDAGLRRGNAEVVRQAGCRRGRGAHRRRHVRAFGPDTHPARQAPHDRLPRHALGTARSPARVLKEPPHPRDEPRLDRRAANGARPRGPGTAPAGRRPFVSAQGRARRRAARARSEEQGKGAPGESIMSEFLRVERAGAVATIWIDRQPKMNTMTVAMRKEFPGIFASLEADEGVRVVVVRGAGGKAFSAGGDVAEFLTLAPADLELWGDTLSAAERCRKPVIAAIDGYTMGAGLELAVACDFRVATLRSEFAFPEVRLGMIPGSGGTQRALRLMGMTRAKLFMMTGQRISAERAEAWGLITLAVANDGLGKAVDPLAGELAERAPPALPTPQ